MTITKLIEEYEKNRDSYLKPNYNETQLRNDFLDPFFKFLGWDIGNIEGKATNEREVLLEEGLKEDANSNTKKPDYTFRLFSQRKFFLEAKKPSVKIESDNAPAKQVRRYGFTAKLKISVLSNFEYLSIYDCSHEVKEDDLVENSRVTIYHYSEYVDKFEEIKTQLGKDVVYSGKFDESWKHIEDKLRLFSVDSLFLTQINDWRISLGKEIYSHNSNIDELELNDLVQQYLNSIIFLRVCEDRNLETYKTLLSYAETNDFNALIDQFEKSDKKYNAGLFDNASTKDIITSGYSAFWGIIQQLYYPESTFSFSVFSSDILGNIYEIFLGEQLTIEGGEIYLRKKEEHVDRDIVTTPTFIIQDILRQTVVNFCNNKTDDEILNATFCDIACGSGAFLLEVCQLLHDTLIDYYIENDLTKLIHTSVDTYKLPFYIKKRIIENCIFGVDKDFNAVRACRFGLLLKLLEGEENDSITTPALPNIDSNIRFGNSLIDTPQTSEDNYMDINPCDFEKQKFDVIVGNPPYMSTEHMKQFTPIEVPLYKSNYYSAYKQFDKYFLFVERAIQLLKDGGVFGYIIPSKFTKVGAGKNLRDFLSRNQYVDKLISFGANQVFQDKTTYTCLLILKKELLDSFDYLEINNIQDWETRNISSDEIDSVGFDNLINDGWVLFPKKYKSIYAAIEKQSDTLENIIGSENIYNGIQTSANRIYIQKPSKVDDDYIYFTKDNIDWKIEKILTRPYFETPKKNSIEPTDLYTYRPFSPNSFVVYPYLKIGNDIEFLDFDQLQADFPFTYQFLTHYKDELVKRDIKPEPETQNEWYRYGRHQCLDKCDVDKKIIVGVLSKGDKYAIDYHSTFLSSGGTAGYCLITIPDECKYSIYYIQAILNSKYSEWFAILIGEVFRGGYVAHGSKVLKKLPIRIIDFEKPEEKSIHDSISSLQESLISLQGQIDTNKDMRKKVPLETRFSATKLELNNQLKSLYNLGESDMLIPLISEYYASN